jgi:hypothetical protein
MISRLMILPVVFLLSGVTQAQLPSQNRVTPINYFGRFHGFGYSDGYHACKDERPKAWYSWSPLSGMSMSMSSFYGEPTLPPSTRDVGPVLPRRAPYAPAQIHYTEVHPYSQSLSPATSSVVNPAPGPYYSPAPAVQVYPQPTTPPLQMTPQQAAPMQVSPPVQLTPNPSTPSFYEPVPPAPMKRPESPSDKDYFELPGPNQPAKDQSQSAPSVQGRRVPPGSQSLIHQSMYRKR